MPLGTAQAVLELAASISVLFFSGSAPLDLRCCLAHLCFPRRGLRAWPGVGVPAVPGFHEADLEVRMVLSGGLHEASGVGMPGLSPCKVCDRGWAPSRPTQDLGGHDLLWEGSLEKESEGQRMGNEKEPSAVDSVFVFPTTDSYVESHPAR